MASLIERAWNRLTAPIDTALLTTILLLASAGMGILYSPSGESSDRLAAQVRNLSRQLMRLAAPLYGVGLALLIAVALFGDTRLGAKRWLNLGVTSIQPWN